jgi:hypothetical protein
VRKISKTGGQNGGKRARMVLQNANNQLYPPFPKLKPANFPNMTAKSTPALFCKTFKTLIGPFFERNNGKTVGINCEIHA